MSTGGAVHLCCCCTLPAVGPWWSSDGPWCDQPWCQQHQPAQAAAAGEGTQEQDSATVTGQLKMHDQVVRTGRCLQPLSSSFHSGQFDKMKSPFEWDIVTRGLVAMTIEGFVGFFITIMCQYNFFRKPQ